MCGLAIATPFYDHVRMYEISNLGCVWITYKSNLIIVINALRILH